MPDTIFTKDIHEINKFFSKYKKMIIKPIHSFGGNDIHLIEKKINQKLILNFIKKHGHIMCQKFLPKIKFGDKRIFIINGKVSGAISRVPKKGSFLSNMSKGAIPIAIELTKIEKKISNILAKDLKKKDIYFSLFTTSPSLSTICRLPNLTKLLSCVIKIIVLPSLCSFRIISITSTLVTESKLPVGSSASITSGSFTSALAIATLCC